MHINERSRYEVKVKQVGGQWVTVTNSETNRRRAMSRVALAATKPETLGVMIVDYTGRTDSVEWVVYPGGRMSVVCRWRD